eukprot:TRINITY_DN3427_c0_g1_i1.p1 TRINITY_DN3427_c0_g1~~TRINITY_DN3427_c0_g1_i1.p1  ORF type:complete len:381 (-),score=123.14 TRINITY_DN3427_c0_g1_i1:637-1779(-)
MEKKKETSSTRGTSELARRLLASRGGTGASTLPRPSPRSSSGTVRLGSLSSLSSTDTGAPMDATTGTGDGRSVTISSSGTGPRFAPNTAAPRRRVLDGGLERPSLQTQLQRHRARKQLASDSEASERKPRKSKTTHPTIVSHSIGGGGGLAGIMPTRFSSQGIPPPHTLRSSPHGSIRMPHTQMEEDTKHDVMESGRRGDDPVIIPIPDADELEDGQIPPQSLGVSGEDVFGTLGKMVRDEPSGAFILQFPPILPPFKAKKQKDREDKQDQQDEEIQQRENLGTEEGYDKRGNHPLCSYPRGKLGAMRVYKSGRIEMTIGHDANGAGTPFILEEGSSIPYHSQMWIFDPTSQKITAIGEALYHRALAVPDFLSTDEFHEG